MKLNCQNVTRIFQTHNSAVTVLQDVTFSAEEKEFLCIVGPSGCGRTTLLKLMAGLQRPTSGQITFHSELTTNKLRDASVFQEHGIFPWMIILDNVAFGLEMQGMRRREQQNRARMLIEKIGLTHFISTYPHELSVGMRQRVGIAVELTAAQTGLGHMIWLAWETMRLEELYIGLVVISVLGIGFNMLLQSLRNTLSPGELVRRRD